MVIQSDFEITPVKDVNIRYRITNISGISNKHVKQDTNVSWFRQNLEKKTWESN